jgi:hypothetical protein
MSPYLKKQNKTKKLKAKKGWGLAQVGRALA